MNETVDHAKKLIDFVAKKYEAGELDDDALVQLIELSAKYLNLKTIAEYARSNKLSYNGVKNYRKFFLISKVKFVVDNF